jgi:hypothetical protein
LEVKELGVAVIGVRETNGIGVITLRERAGDKEG